MEIVKILKRNIMDNKEEARKRLQNIEKEVENLRRIINSEKSYTTDDIDSYEIACLILDVKPESSCSSEKKLKTIIKAANFLDNSKKVWITDFTKSDYKYIPYFNRGSSGFSFSLVDFYILWTYLPAAFYFKNSDTAKKIGIKFINLYKEWLEE